MGDYGVKHYVDEEGLEILIRIGPLEDLGGVGDVRIDVKKPDGTLVTWSATLVTDYDSDYAYIRHITAGGSVSDLDVAGEYELQAYGVLGSWRGLGETVKLIIWDDFS